MTFNVKYFKTCMWSRQKTQEGCTILNLAKLQKSSEQFLGVVFDENLNFDACTHTLSSSAGRALAKLLLKFICLKKNFHIKHLQNCLIVVCGSYYINVLVFGAIKII